MEILNHIPQPIIAGFAFFVITVFLVAIHEFGHFWTARKFGVRIEKFSIGFGKPLIKWTGKRDNTEYSISMIPLGGYVKMYGESKETIKNNDDDIEKTDTAKHDVSDFTNVNNNTGSFSALPAYKRFIIAFAGPAVNLLFAVFAFWLLFMVGIKDIAPNIGSISPVGQLAHSKFKHGDVITSINGREVTTITQTVIGLINDIGAKNVTVTAKRGTQTISDQIDLSNLKKGDELHIEKSLGLTWEIQNLFNNSVIPTLRNVQANSPAAKAGLKIGDKILTVDDVKISTWSSLVNIIKNSLDKKLTVIVERDKKQLSLTLIPEKNPDNSNLGFAGFSPTIDAAAQAELNKLIVIQRYNPIIALGMAIKQPAYQAQIVLKTLGRMIIGKASIDNMGGPITIADFSGQALRDGPTTFFNFMASISLMLAIMNLLPIPALDGGHMLLCVIEMIKRKPLKEKSIEILMRIGFAVLISFMVLVVFKDFWKYLGDWIFKIGDWIFNMI